jgi:hypothetical protein
MEQKHIAFMLFSVLAPNGTKGTKNRLTVHQNGVFKGQPSRMKKPGDY